eukprot:UN30599
MYGRKAGLFLTLDIMIFNFLTLVAYLLVMGSQISAVLTTLIGHESWYYSPWFTMIVCSTISLPLSTMDSIEKLGFTSMLGVIAVWFTVGMITYDGFDKGRASRAEMFIWEPKLVQVFPLTFFALFCQITVVPATEELRLYWPSKTNPGKIRFRTLVLVCIFTMTMCICLYIPSGICGYFLFGKDTAENVLDNYGDDANNDHSISMPSDWSLKISRVCMAMTTFFSFPVITWLNRGAWYDLKHMDPLQQSKQYVWTWTILHTALSCVISLGLNAANLNIGFVMSVVGS